MSTTDSRPDYKSNTMLGLGCNEGLGPLPDARCNAGTAAYAHNHNTPLYTAAEVLAMLAAERERCAQASDDYLISRLGCTYGAGDAARGMELRQLRAYADTLNLRCIADAQDAERYRWLRDKARTSHAVQLLQWLPGAMDAKVDEAMRATRADGAA